MKAECQERKKKSTFILRNGYNYSYYHRENEAEQVLKNENMIKDQFKMHSYLAVNSIQYTSEHF